MKIEEIYRLAIKEGVRADFRSEEYINQIQQRLKDRYDKMTDAEKEVFDIERLSNPFSDSRILFGDHCKEVKRVLVGIDIDGEEILLAKELGNIDLIISHHPRGIALAGLDDVMQLQIDILNLYGVPVNIAEKLLKKRISEVSRSLSSANHERAVDIARHLNIPLMCVHTPCDNMATRVVDDKLKEDKPFIVKDVIDSLMSIPEYKIAEKNGSGPKIFVGGSDNRVGNIVITEMTGGTEGSSDIYEKLAQSGAGTIIGMHISEKHREEAEKANVNVVIAGHISSDSVGVNLFLDMLEKQGIEIIPCGGLIRVSRNV
ncbi:MAG: NIF3 (NGG1p interacting factor 3) [Parcubacteria group bacterium ADurb.Bin247]|jgi:putative NIF3 family GTP cyclohydrolase 1 type 2|nr:MAG: NIF3 (NGG1p interacting factor 3) [Parcubacteria group bacterium ADurb.Bin247]